MPKQNGELDVLALEKEIHEALRNAKKQRESAEMRLVNAPESIVAEAAHEAAKVFKKYVQWRYESHLSKE